METATGPVERQAEQTGPMERQAESATGPMERQAMERQAESNGDSNWSSGEAG